MAKTVVGQVTWADPSLNKTCDQCSQCQRHPKPPKNGGLKDQCALVKVHSGVEGAPFMARKAIACSKFKG